MELNRRFGLSECRFRALILTFVVAYVVAIQLPLLSPYRLVPADEMVLVDAAYGVSSGHSIVPAGWFWSHTIPVTATYFDAFRPLYLYVLAAMLKIFGVSVISVGYLHLCLRLIATAIFFAISRQITQNVIGSAGLSAIWATFAHGPVGRFEDLVVVLLLAALYLLINFRDSYRRLGLAGIFAGLAFLTYPGYLTLVPLAAVAMNFRLETLFNAQNRSILSRRAFFFVGTTACTAALWLFWIVPWWHEFKVHFLEFAVPDALAPSYSDSLIDLIDYVVGGFLTSPFPFHYSLLPLLGLLALLIILDIKHNKLSFQTMVAITLPLSIGLLTARVRIHKTYNLIYFITTILILLPLLQSRVFTRQHISGISRLSARAIFCLLMLLISLQLIAHLLLAGLGFVGDIAAVNACGASPHASLINQIPPSEKVITNSAAVFYNVRHQNRVYWPSGLHGETPGGLPFSSSYDDSFRWLVLTRSLTEADLKNANPGGNGQMNSDT